jgi:SAM-dependent methyltransferase
MDLTPEEHAFLSDQFRDRPMLRLYPERTEAGELQLRGWYVRPGQEPPELGLTFAGERLHGIETYTWGYDEAITPEAQASRNLLPWWPGLRGAGLSVRVPNARLEALARHTREVPVQVVDAAGRLVASRWDTNWISVPDARHPADTPSPPAPLIARVMGYDSEPAWRHSGLTNLRNLEAAAWEAAGVALRHTGPVLEWGSGCGRVTRHLVAAGVPVVGADIDAEAVGWCARNLAPGLFIQAGLAPPLPLTDASFGAVIAVSVLTHLDAEHEALWLAEMARLLRPGGVLLATVHGFSCFSDVRSTTVLREMRDLGASHSVVGATLNAVLGEGQTYYRETFHTEAWIRERWSADFELLALHPGAHFAYQDIVVLRRR